MEGVHLCWESMMVTVEEMLQKSEVSPLNPHEALGSRYLQWWLNKECHLMLPLPSLLCCYPIQKAEFLTCHPSSLSRHLWHSTASHTCQIRFSEFPGSPFEHVCLDLLCGGGGSGILDARIMARMKLEQRLLPPHPPKITALLNCVRTRGLKLTNLLWNLSTFWHWSHLGWLFSKWGLEFSQHYNWPPGCKDHFS